MNSLALREHLKHFLMEDIGHTDITSRSIFPDNQQGNGLILAREDGVISGLQVIGSAYHLLDPAIEVTTYTRDGERVQAGETIAEITGPVSQLLAGERVILNLIQRMSGIATLTSKCISLLNDPSIHLYDTRKTTPGLRMFEKYAVTTGGGKNHRYGLYDGMMIKDNHISYCGSITKAVRTARQKTGHMMKIEVETETKAEVIEAVEAGADVIMFDNRSPKEVKEFAALVPKSIITEASGGITPEDLPFYADTNVNYISLGFLTHSAKALDISFQVNEGEKK
ncbi:carboxylating nicotinate-nucleotide diphosphorylase [Virgibacillus xinjiangensis]|uniref:nicotinate-nucleotide diphosphorylase (carboxylating) n=1 Tax=Virgibacillus xinjiangensis TaxID=393090 RepID=A0ABV7CR42_9BACI